MRSSRASPSAVRPPVAILTRQARPKSRHAGAGYMFVAPFMIVFAAMFIAPLAYAAYLSLYSSRLVGGNAFVGLQNYTQALQDSQFLSGLGRIALFFLIQVPIMIVLATFFALMLDSGRLRAPRVFRIAFFVPRSEEHTSELQSLRHLV